jgi:hypothetical protein
VNKSGFITAEDQTLIYRVVGTLEYLSALRHLDAFLNVATAEELAAADRIVSSRPQFTVYTKLADSTRAGPSAKPSSPALDQKAGQRKGLKWVVALARVETGAILATFTQVPSPFEVIGPSRWEMPAYKELLLDGAQTHFWGLMNDPYVKVVAMKAPDADLLAYIRRLTLARAMLSAAARSNAPDLTAQQWNELGGEEQQLVTLQNAFSQRVQNYLASLKTSSASQSVDDFDKIRFSKICGTQLAGIQAEMLSGTAQMAVFKTRKN